MLQLTFSGHLIKKTAQLHFSFNGKQKCLGRDIAENREKEGMEILKIKFKVKEILDTAERVSFVKMASKCKEYLSNSKNVIDIW